ncbi:MAG: carboxypeptidase regulatory-like domain-containing protein, partial [Acidobacteria bacterium]|nr:carboxypeptidase regulatory-like domain-containing protein [Acidobacteriota bacterium]
MYIIPQDSTGGVVPGASITVSNVETGISRTLSTDGQGRYRAPNLRVGLYEVQGSLAGFQTAVRSGIELTVGRNAVVNFTLQVGQVAERVEVTGEAPLVETTNATISGIATEETLRSLPLSGRSFTDVMLLQTGTHNARVDESSITGGDAFDGGAKISISGARPGMNAYLLDGTDIKDSRTAAPGGIGGRQLGVDAIREFRLLTNSYSAEDGKSAGGVLTVVTKSGTNTLHGTAFEFLRNDRLDAVRWESNARGSGDKPPFKRNQFGGTVGGPIIQDKTFFFGAVEVLRDRLAESTVIDVPTARAKTGCLPEFGIEGNDEVCISVHPRTQTWLNFYPDPNGPTLDFGDGTGEHNFAGSQKTNQEYFMARVDHSFSQSHSIFARYTFDNSERLAPPTPL